MATTARQALAAVVRNSESYKEDVKRMAAEKRQAQKEQDQAFLVSLQTPTTVSEMNTLVEMMPSASKKVQKALCQMFASLRNEEGFIVLETTQYFTTEDGYVVYSQPVPQQEETAQEPEQVEDRKGEVTMATTNIIDQINEYGKQIKDLTCERDATQQALRLAILDSKDDIEHYKKSELVEELQARNATFDSKARKDVLVAGLRTIINERIQWLENRIAQLNETLTRLQAEREVLQREESRHVEAQKVQSVASELDIPASEVATIAAIAQEVKQQKQQDRATFEAETKLETVSSGELTDEQRDAILAQKRAESEAYLARIDRETQAYIQEEIARSQIQRQEELQHMTFDQEVRILKAFHDQHSTETGMCAWCHHRVPSQQLTSFPVTIDQNTGMADEEEFVCDECLEPVRRQQAETDAGYGLHNPESPNYDCFEEDL